ncbi:GPP34 family phosphoprotein [Isoptericola halotolerans]|uniref:GOLPH3/VPS74 family protein n=1 Tax=Isoptericola halotolerans TaxID=300560 RepID=UPI00388DEA40
MTTEHPDDARPAPVTAPQTTDSASFPGEPTLAEDLLLLLFQPGSGTIAGEGTLYYVLAGAVLADLSLGEHVQTSTGRTGSLVVGAVGDRPPADPLLRTSWEYVAGKARGVQTVLAATGPSLRQPLLDRLVDRGDLHRRTRKALGLFTSSVLEEGDSGRRARVLGEVRAVLVDRVEPTPRTAALAALLYGSGTMPQLDRDIPWTSPVIARAEELTEGSWGAEASAKAVTRTVTAVIVNSVVAAAAALPR